VSEETTHTITLKLGKGYGFLATFDKRPDLPPLLLDEPPPLGEGRGPNAAALLAAAVGHCLASSLLFCLRKSRADVSDLTASVSARIVRNEKGRFRIGGIDVEISPALPPDSAGRLPRCAEMFEDFCVVTESVRKGIPVAVTLKTPEGTFSV
jgi:organic hydroperoxide reductase OsmC/OhrA